jgi:hypothetical protein
MKTQSINWNESSTNLTGFGTRIERAARKTPGAFDVATGQLVRTIGAILAAASILLAAIWANQAFAGTGVPEALIWTSGLVFLALAVESSAEKFVAFLATGLVLPILAILSAKLASEFAVVAAGVLATWASLAVLKYWHKA